MTSPDGLVQVIALPSVFKECAKCAQRIAACPGRGILPGPFRRQVPIQPGATARADRSRTVPASQATALRPATRSSAGPLVAGQCLGALLPGPPGLAHSCTLPSDTLGNHASASNAAKTGEHGSGWPVCTRLWRKPPAEHDGVSPPRRTSGWQRSPSARVSKSARVSSTTCCRGGLGRGARAGWRRRRVGGHVRCRIVPEVLGGQHRFGQQRQHRLRHRPVQHRAVAVTAAEAAETGATRASRRSRCVPARTRNR